MKRVRHYEERSCKYCGQSFVCRNDSPRKYCSRKCGSNYRQANGIIPVRHGFRRDISGQTFGKLIAVKPTEQRSNGGKVIWECNCDCGNIAYVALNNLVSGGTKSCGCLIHETLMRRNTTHGHTNSRLHSIWSGMKTRCSNPNRNCSKYYLERGIDVCDEWKTNFDVFEKWAMENGYDDNLTLDRIDNDKGYSPDNCRWATWHEQRMNQRRMKK